MKQIFSVLLVSLFVVQSAWADDITAPQALQIAKQFAISNGQSNGAKGKAATAEPRLAHTVKSKSSQKDNVYVINLGNDQGFVLVSGDDRAEQEILGYCDHGAFEYDKAPVQLHDLLEGYSCCIDKARNTPSSTVKRKARNMGDIVVGPLLTTKWDQNYPFNKYCPGGCPAGCLPIAYAQVMNYWHWPEKTKGMVGKEDFSGRTYDWDNMLDTYRFVNAYEHCTEAQADAVARLVADIGKACGTEYTETGSPTYFVPKQLISNFDYWPDIEWVRYEDVGLLFPYIKKELDARRPVLYCGYSGLYNAYHALVCDGYTTEKYMHFNYGWGGYSDGWYYGYSDFYSDGSIFVNLRPYDCEEIVQDDIRYRIYPDGKAEIIKYERDHARDIDLTIPATITDAEGKSHDVVRILSGTFSTTCMFNTVTIGENVTGMEPHCFTNSHIKKLIIGDKVETIPDYAFQLTGVNELIIGASVKHIGKMAFAYCQCNTVTSKSPAFTVGKGAFSTCRINNFDWFGCITELADSAFLGATFGSKFASDGVSPFRQLKSIGKGAFDAVQFPDKTFYIPASLRRIEDDAFGNSLLSKIVVDEGNPYFSNNDDFFRNMLFNKNGTTLIYATPVCRWEDRWPEGVVRLGPNSIPAHYQRNESIYGVGHEPKTLTIPNTVEDVTGAFRRCSLIKNIKCYAVMPPAATDDTFSDVFFKDGGLPLYVPKGTAELYAGAPGWRRFTNIIEMDEYNPPAPSTDRQYYMVLHCSDPSAKVSSTEGRDEKVKSIRIPVSDVREISVGDYVTGSGPSLKISKIGGDENACRVDSITWMRGFVYGNSEVIDLDPDNRVAEAQNCTVKFNGASIDSPVQLSVKEVVTVPSMPIPSRNAATVDISLSNDVHELNGTAEITIPVKLDADERPYAAYYNTETGEWEPAFATYDEERQQVTIITDHLSMFSVGCVDTRLEQFQELWSLSYILYDPVNTFNGAVAGLLELATSDDPDALAFQKAKSDLGEWTTFGLDGFASLASGLGWTHEAFDDAVGKLAWVSTASTFLDAAAADIKGDNVNVAVNSLKTIMSIAGNYAGAVVGTQMLSLSMGAIAFIGVALDRLGTMVKNARMDYVRAMYYYYYSKEGANECSRYSNFSRDGNSYYRDYNAWYNIFEPALRSPRINDPNAYIEQVVRRYCDQFWEETSHQIETYCEAEAYRKGFASSLWITDAEKQAVCDEYYAELINGPIAKVVSDIRQNLAAEQFRSRYVPAAVSMAKYMNTKLGFVISDSSCPGDGESKYSGWKIRFTEIPSDVKDPEEWQAVIDEHGNCRMGFFTLYSLYKHKVKPQFTLIDLNGVERATYDYKIPDGENQIVLGIDLATTGNAIANPHLDNLKLVYDTGDFDTEMKYYFVGIPKESIWYYSMSHNYLDFGGKSNLNDDHSKIAIFGSTYIHKNYREQSAVEQCFNDIHEIKVDEMGTIFFGDQEVGKFPDNGLKGSGKFTISVKNPFHYRTADEYIDAWNANTSSSADFLDESIERYAEILDINLQHDIVCNFEITRNEDNSEYDITYHGEGTYVLDLHYISEIHDLEWSKASFSEVDENGDPERWWIEDFCSCPIESVKTTNRSFKGKVTLDYSQKFEVDPAIP